MRNLVEYPLTADEAIKILQRLSDDLQSCGPDFLVGDMRPYALEEVANFLILNATAFEEFVKIKP